MFKISDEDIMSIVRESYKQKAKEVGFINEDEQLDIKSIKVDETSPFKLMISEKLWGRSRDSTVEGRLLQAVASKLKGDTAIDKFLDLNNYIERESSTSGDGCSFDQIFARITILNTISCLINEFESGAAGQIFEGFVAGVLGGEQVQSGGAVADDLVDIMTSDAFYSIKLLSSLKSVKGSYALLYDSLEKNNRSLNYIVFVKGRGTSIQMFEFSINKENIYNFFTPQAKDSLDLYFTLRDDGQSDQEARSYISVERGTNMQSKFYIRPGFYKNVSKTGIINIDVREILASVKGNLKFLAKDAENLLTSVNNMIEQMNGFLLAKVDSDNAQASADAVKNKINDFAARQQSVCN
jgi:hypothetical protein